MLVFGLFVWLASIAGVIAIASNKGRPDAGAVLAIVAIFIGPLALLPAVLLSRDDEHLRQRLLAKRAHRICPACAELVRREAVKCRYCATALEALPLPEVRQPIHRSPVERSPEDQARIDRMSRRAAIATAVVGGLLVLLFMVPVLWSIAESIVNQYGYRLLPPAEWFGR